MKKNLVILVLSVCVSPALFSMGDADKENYSQNGAQLGYTLDYKIVDPHDILSSGMQNKAVAKPAGAARVVSRPRLEQQNPVEESPVEQNPVQQDLEHDNITYRWEDIEENELVHALLELESEDEELSPAGALPYCNTYRQEIAPRPERVEELWKSIDKADARSKQIDERLVKRLAARKMQEQLQEAKILMKQGEYLLELMRGKKMNIANVEKAVEGWQRSADRLDYDIKAGKIYSQEALTTNRARLSNARRITQECIVLRGGKAEWESEKAVPGEQEQKIDYEKVDSDNFERLCEEFDRLSDANSPLGRARFELSENIDKYIAHAKKLVTAIEHFQKEADNIPEDVVNSILAPDLNLQKLDEHKRSWECEIEKTTERQREKVYTRGDESDIRRWKVHQQKWNPLIDRMLGSIEKYIDKLKQYELARENTGAQ
jgi:hypothetical protein